MTLGRRLQTIDRRILYALLVFMIALPFLGVPLPFRTALTVTPPTQSFYDTIEKVAADPVLSQKLVIVSPNYGSGTLAENQSQCEAVIRHLMKRNLRFALFTFIDPQGRELGQRAVENILKGDKDGQFAAYQTYGEKWCNWGYRPPGASVQIVKSMVGKMPSAITNDIKGTAFEKIPALKGVTGSKDVSMVINFASTNSLPTWIQYFTSEGEDVRFLYCPTGVMASEAFPLLKSGQLSGMLSGLSGAIEYEGLLGEKGFASRCSASLSLAHILIIGLIVIGNVGMLLERREATR